MPCWPVRPAAPPPECVPASRGRDGRVTRVFETTSAELLLKSGGTVIAASHRLARQIGWRHDLSRKAAGLRAWTRGDVLPLDAWLQRVWEEHALAASGLGRLRLLSEDESRLIWRRVLRREGGNPLDAGLVVPLVAAGWRLCQRFNIPLLSVQSQADSEDGRIFARWVRAYEEELARRSWIDPGGLLQACGGVLTLGLRHQTGFVGLAGFEPWTPAVARMADALSASGHRVVRIAPPRRAGTCRVVATRHGQDELARAADWAGQHRTQNPEDGVGILVPHLSRDGALARRIGLHQLAPGWQLHEPPVRPLAVSAGRQLDDYPVALCAFTLLEWCANDLGFAPVSRLLRSPYVAWAELERTGRARAELTLRRQPLAWIPRATLLAVLEQEAPLAWEQWGQAGRLAARLGSTHLPPSAWTRHFGAWLAAAGWPGNRGLNSEEYQATQAWGSVLQAFAVSDEVVGSLALGPALEWVGQLLRDRPFEPESSPGAVQVLSLGEAEGQDFRALWVCGFTGDQWPPPTNAHPLVPLALQRSAGVPEACPVALEKATRQRFARLLTCADHLVLSFPVVRDEAETLPSPLLQDWPGVAHPLAEEQESHPDRQRVACSGVLEEVALDPAPPWPPDKLLPGGARVFMLQAVCPARAFVEFQLGGTGLEAPAEPLDAPTRGCLVHRLLEKLYRLEPCTRGLALVDTGLLKRLFAPVVQEVLEEFLPSGDAFLERLRCLERERLWTLVVSLRELDGLRGDFRVETEVARRVCLGPLNLRVRLDRLDRLATGGALVIDYKTGVFASAGWQTGRLTECQLPLYAVTELGPEAVRGVAALQLRAPGALLRGVGDEHLGMAGIKTPREFFTREELAWSGVLGRWQQQLLSLAREFSGGDFRVNPSDNVWAGGQFAGLTRLHAETPREAPGDLPEGPSR